MSVPVGCQKCLKTHQEIGKFVKVWKGVGAVINQACTSCHFLYREIIYVHVWSSSFFLSVCLSVMLMALVHFSDKCHSSCRSSCICAVSRYTNAFAITQLCGVLCAPWNGLIMDRLKGKPRAAGNKHAERNLSLKRGFIKHECTLLNWML